jgi:hypothetical protein
MTSTPWRRRPLARHAVQHRLPADAGAVMIEFLIAFPPVLLLFLGAIQLALLAAADLAVRHAAIEGLRSAVVVLDDDPQHYGGEARLQIAGDRRSGSRRMAAIRSAVHARLVAVAPGARMFAQLLMWGESTSVATAIGDTASRAAIGSTRYLPIATAVVFPRTPGGSSLQDAEVTADPVVLRVTHLVPCAVPIVSALLCRSIRWDAWHKRMTISGADRRMRHALEELQQAPAAEQQLLLAATSMRFAVVQSEASMPLHAAPYRYQSERAEP